MRISFRKISDERHELAIERQGRLEQIECETRSFLRHDLLHYAVESEARRSGGFWGHLASGKTLAEMKDEASQLFHDPDGELAWIERIVGALHRLDKGPSADVLAAGIRSVGDSLGSPPPDWLTVELITAVQERMRQLFGRWRATACGASMDLTWP